MSQVSAVDTAASRLSSDAKKDTFIRRLTGTTARVHIAGILVIMPNLCTYVHAHAHTHFHDHASIHLSANASTHVQAVGMFMNMGYFRATDPLVIVAPRRTFYL